MIAVWMLVGVLLGVLGTGIFLALEPALAKDVTYITLRVPEKTKLNIQRLQRLSECDFETLLQNSLACYRLIQVQKMDGRKIIAVGLDDTIELDL